jgi:uncharacterized protein
MHLDWTHGPLAEGLHCYNTAEFFAAHEHWESVWLTAPQPEKTFLQALIQITVAMHHLSRHNTLGATRLLTAALHKLDPLPPSFGGLNITLLRDDIRHQLPLLSTGEPTPRLTPPRILPLTQASSLP